MNKDEILDLLFPKPLHEKYFLWAHHFEETDGGLWSHPGSDPDEPLLTTQGAISATYYLDVVFLTTKITPRFSREILWEMAARYQWLCAFDESRDPANEVDIRLWAIGRLPDLEALL